jgi:hypothetical protein
VGEVKLSTTDRNTLLICREPLQAAGLNEHSVRKLLQFGYLRQFIRDSRFFVQTTDLGKQAQ